MLHIKKKNLIRRHVQNTNPATNEERKPEINFVKALILVMNRDELGVVSTNQMSFPSLQWTLGGTLFTEALILLIVVSETIAHC